MKIVLDQLSALEEKVDRIVKGWDDWGNWLFLASISVLGVNDFKYIPIIAVFIFFLTDYPEKYKLINSAHADIKRLLDENFSALEINGCDVYEGVKWLVEEQAGRIGFWGQIRSSPKIVVAIVTFVAVSLFKYGFIEKKII